MKWWLSSLQRLGKWHSVLLHCLNQCLSHARRQIYYLLCGVCLNQKTGEGRASSQIDTFVQALYLDRKNVSCHAANILAENGYKSNFDYYPCRDALGPTNHFPSRLVGEDKGEGDNWAGRSRAIGLRSQLSSASTGVLSPLDGEG